MEIPHARDVKEITEITLQTRHASLIEKAVEKITEASAKGSFKVVLIYGAEMNHESRDYIKAKLEEADYNVKVQYNSWRNESEFMFEISWGKD